MAPSKKFKSDAWQDPEICEALSSDPAATIQQFGLVLDQELGEPVQYDPYRITGRLQATIMAYYAAPPRTEDGRTRFLTLLAARQTGKSLTAEYGIYPIASYRTGWRHSCVADTRDRADTLHERVQFLHKNWPEEIRTPTQSSTETRSLSFVNGSKMIVQSAHVEDFGIGQSLNSFHGSEYPWWANAAKAMSMMLPSMINRRDVLMVKESTPAPMSEPSAEYWQDECMTAKRWQSDQTGRDLYAFFPFWDSVLNRRKWDPRWTLEAEEERMLAEYGENGTKHVPGMGYLELPNLAFRREMMRMDREIRRNPDLFKVYYPFDDLTCWISHGSGVIREHVLAKHKDNANIEWQKPLMKFKKPDPSAVYVMGVDPAGMGLRDHAAFVVLEVWSDRWEVVACYSDVVDPVSFQDVMLAVAAEYHALLAIERNGVGMSAITHAIRERYPRMFYGADDKPGIVSHAHDQLLENLIDALMDLLVIPDRDLVAQLTGYRNDKALEADPRSEIRREAAGRNRAPGRRDRHHWDKVSALMIACKAARSVPRRIRVGEPEIPKNVIPLHNATFDVWNAYRQKVAKMSETGQDKRIRYTSFRKKRR
jgi:hypothetical protein